MEIVQSFCFVNTEEATLRSSGISFCGCYWSFNALTLNFVLHSSHENE